MSVNHTEVLMARNRTKRQYKIYLHEATANMLEGFADGTRSENICAIVNAFLRRIGKDVSFLDENTLSQINKLRRAITALK